MIDIVDGAIERVRPLAELRRVDVDGARTAAWRPGERRPPPARRRRSGNLVENAVKYSESGSAVQVRVRVEGQLVEIMVADQGIGIPAPTSTGSSSASTASTRRAAGTPAAPVSGSRSCATSPPTTAATCSCRPRRARARRSSCASRTATVPEPSNDVQGTANAVECAGDPRGRGRGELRRGPVDRAAARGLRGRGGRRRVRGARPVRQGAARPRAARRDAAEDQRHRRVPPAAQAQPGADHHGDGQGRRDRHRRRPRGGRRRLRHQAVPDPRARGAHPGRAAARRPATGRASSARLRSRSATCRSTPTSTR